MIDANKVEQALDLWRGLSESERDLFRFGQRYAAMPSLVERKRKGRPPGAKNKNNRKFGVAPEPKPNGTPDVKV